jgi:hypothetical protein
MKRCAAFVPALVVALLGTGVQVQAGPIVESAQRAEALSGEGKHLEALAALGEAVDQAWNASPLLIRKAILVDQTSGFGRYEPRTSEEVTADERLTIYVEPVGFAFGKAGDNYATALAVDVAIQNTTGQVLVEVRDLFTLRTEAREKQREFSMAMRHPIPYLRPGKYAGVYTVRDLNSDKSASFEIPFTVVAGAATPEAAVPPASEPQSRPADAPAGNGG